MNLLFETYDPLEDDYARIDKKLIAFTASKSGPKFNPVQIAARAITQDGDIAGDILAVEKWKQVEIKLLVVDEIYRGKGIGKKLVSIAEDFARDRGALGIRLWTPTFQGKGFYERCGYEAQFQMPIEKAGLDHVPEFILYYKAL